MLARSAEKNYTGARDPYRFTESESEVGAGLPNLGLGSEPSPMREGQGGGSVGPASSFTRHPAHPAFDPSILLLATISLIWPRKVDIFFNGAVETAGIRPDNVWLALRVHRKPHVIA